MPTMVRPKGKAKRIAYAILGTPANMDEKKTEKEKKQDQRVTFIDITRAK